MKDHIGNMFSDDSVKYISTAKHIKIVAVTGGYNINVPISEKETHIVRDSSNKFIVYTFMFMAKKAITDINPKAKITLVNSVDI